MRLTVNTLAAAIALALCLSFPGDPASAGQRKVASATVPAIDLKKIDRDLATGSISDQDLESLNTLVDRDPANCGAHLLLGRYYEQNGYGTLARQEYETALRLNPQKAEPMVSLIHMKFSAGNYSEANSLAAEALRRFPNEYMVLVTQAMLLLRQNELDESEKYYKRAFVVNPYGEDVPIGLAEIQLRRHKYGEALELVETVLKRNPTAPTALATKGKVLWAMGKYNDSMPLLKSAFDQDHFNLEVARPYALGLIRQGRLNSALGAALYVLAVDSKDNYHDLPKAKTTVGNLFQHETRSQALQTIESVQANLRKTPYGAYFHFSLGDLFDHLGEHVLAIKHYRLGLSLDPNFARGYLRLGEDLEDYCHDYEGAMAMYQRAFALKKEDKEVRARVYALALRLSNQKNDLAWTLREQLFSFFHPDRKLSADASIPFAQ